MSRQAVIDGLVGQIQLTSGFEQGNTGTAVAYDHRVLVQGIDRAAIVLAGEGEQKRMVMGLNELTHDIEVQLFIRHNNDVIAARADADIYSHNIIVRINANPTLGGSAFDSIVTRYRVEDEKMEIGRVPYLLEVLTVRAEEHIA